MKKTLTKEIKENYEEYQSLKQYAEDLRATLYATEDRIAKMETSMASKKLIERFGLQKLADDGEISAWEFRFLSGLHRYKHRLSDKQADVFLRIIERIGVEPHIDALFNYLTKYQTLILTSKPTEDESNERKGE